MDNQTLKRITQEYNAEIARLLKMKQRKVSVNRELHSFRTHGDCTIQRTAVNKVSWQIRVSDSLAKDKDIKETILHELCHVYAPPYEHHGPAWKAIAQKVGAHFNVTITRTDRREHTGAIAVVTCPVCGNKSNLYNHGKIYKNITKCWCRRCGQKATQGKLIMEEL